MSAHAKFSPPPRMTARPAAARVSSPLAEIDAVVCAFVRSQVRAARARAARRVVLRSALVLVVLTAGTIHMLPVPKRCWTAPFAAAWQKSFEIGATR